MTTLYLPSPINQNEQYVVELNQKQYTVFLSYQPSFDFWVIKLELDGVVFIESTTLVQGVDVAYNTNLPNDFGRLYISSLTGDHNDPNLDNFGKSVFLTYDAV
jgi:hypothetical protein